MSKNKTVITAIALFISLVFVVFGWGVVYCWTGGKLSVKFLHKPYHPSADSCTSATPAPGEKTRFAANSRAHFCYDSAFLQVTHKTQGVRTFQPDEDVRYLADAMVSDHDSADEALVIQRIRGPAPPPLIHSSFDSTLDSTILLI